MKDKKFKFTGIYTHLLVFLLLITLTGCLEENKELPPLSFIDGKILFDYDFGNFSITAVIVGNKTSLIYYWIRDNNTIDIVMAYSPSSDILPVYKEIISLNLTSPYTGSRIIPYNLRYNDSRKCWHFNYYDFTSYGYYGKGNAFYYSVNHTISWQAHSRSWYCDIC